MNTIARLRDDSDVGLSSQWHKTAMNNILWMLMGKVDNVQEKGR